MIGSRRTLALLALALLAGGCVQRTLSITSDPAGALVFLNDREVGRTPLEVRFLHYGTYDVRLELAGHEPILTSAVANPPWWDQVPLDFFAELTPGEPESHIEWHFALEPARSDIDALVERARTMQRDVTGDGTSP